MARRKNSIEAYVYWFYNKYNFKTYFGSRVNYSGSYVNDFLKKYNSSSENEEFLNALANEELVGEVIAVFTGGTYKEVGKRAKKYEQDLIKLFWKNVGRKYSYNLATDDGNFNTIGRSLPHSQEFIDKYFKGENNPRYIKYCPALLKILRLELKYNEVNIAKIFNTNTHTIGRKLKKIGIDSSKKHYNKTKVFDSDFGNRVSRGLKNAYKNGLKPSNKIEIDYNIIYDLYVNKKLSMEKIAKELNTTLHVIHNRMIEYNIPRRKGGHIKKGAH